MIILISLCILAVKVVNGLSSYFELQIAQREHAHPPRVHYHPDYEVYCLTEGKCRYFIHDKTYSMIAGDLVVIPPGIIHKVIYETPIHSRILFNCTRDYIPPSVLQALESITYYPGHGDTAKQIAALYRRIREAVSAPDAFSEDTIRCCAMELFLLMAKTADAGVPLPTGSSFVAQAVAFIRTSYAEHLTLSAAARHCAVSPEHLSRVFKKETGFGFNEYLNLYRLKKAEALLKSGQDVSVSQVALLCGFNDSNYFSGIYKKTYGISPSQVKKNASKEADYV